MAEKAFINEVGPRDGLQNQAVNVSPADRLRLVQALVEAGVPAIEAGSFVSPKAVPQMAGTDQVVAGLPSRERIFYSVLVPNLRGYELAKEAGIGAVSVPVSATETMNQKNLRMGTQEIVALTCELIASARQDRIWTLVYISVAFACPFEGPVEAAKVEALAMRLFAAGADRLVIADTIGAAHPREVKSLMDNLAAAHGSENLSCHFHDTRALALANVYAALEAGIRNFDSSIGGLGGCPFAPGAAGNVATEDVVMLLQQMGFDTGIDLAGLLAASELAAELTGRSGTGARSAPWLRQQLAAAS